LKGVRVIAINVVKLHTDNIDPRLYFGRLEAWQKRMEEAGAEEWRVVNDLDRLDTVLAQR
ncbi:MAG TPA: VWA domain-containing protein, partial [Burkholderiales bacterium]|nr:VWA domain-containing protein [Burkholderiales bacterium]